MPCPLTLKKLNVLLISQTGAVVQDGDIVYHPGHGRFAGFPLPARFTLERYRFVYGLHHDNRRTLRPGKSILTGACAGTIPSGPIFNPATYAGQYAYISCVLPIAYSPSCPSTHVAAIPGRLMPPYKDASQYLYSTIPRLQLS